jgi:GntR family transcriptional regulator/MocR family aminotransferase
MRCQPILWHDALHLIGRAAAAYLAVARGVRCTADQVIIVASAQAGLSLAANLLLDARDAVWMEDPGYFLAHAVFQAVGAPGRRLDHRG